MLNQINVKSSKQFNIYTHPKSRQTCEKLKILKSTQNIFHNFICIDFENTNFIWALRFQFLD